MDQEHVLHDLYRKLRLSACRNCITSADGRPLCDGIDQVIESIRIQVLANCWQFVEAHRSSIRDLQCRSN